MKKLGIIDNYQKDVLMNYVVKITGILISLLSTRVTINYLGNNIYGLWVTIASIVSWMSSGDFGVGNGLRNQYTSAYAEEDRIRQKTLIATGLTMLSKISILLLVFGCVLCEVLICFNLIQPELRLPMDITVVFFCINLVLSIGQTISYGQQKSWYVSLTSTGMTASSVLVVVALQLSNIAPNLNLFALLHGVCSIIPNMALLLLLRKKGTVIFYRGIRNNYKKELRHDIVGVGMKFFGLQICSIVLYSTDNVIINYLFNGEMVTKYSVITKVYDTGQSLFSILLISLWSAVTYQSVRNNIKWIKNQIKKLLLIWCVYVIGVIAVSFLFNPIVKIWIGQNADYYEPELIALFALYGITVSFSAIFVNVVNGLNQIKLQLIVAIIGAMLNIPLSVFFAKNLGMGILGVKLATFIAALMSAIVIPIQVWFLLYKKDSPQ